MRFTRRPHGILPFLVAVSITISVSCTPQTRYHNAKAFYANENYEAALLSIDAALQAKPQNQDFLLLKREILVALYRSYGLPLIAYHHLSEDETNPTSYLDSLKKKKLLMNEIMGKFTVPIAVRFSDKISEAGRQILRSATAQKLRESCADGFCELRLLEHPDSSASVVLEIDLEDLVVTETKGEPKPVGSHYKSGAIMEPNPDYLRKVVAHRGIIAWQQQLTDLQITSSDRPHWDAEYFVLAEQLRDVNRKLEKSKSSLASTPARIPRPVFAAYQFLETDHVLDIEMVFKYRLVDLCHHTTWKEEAVRYRDTNTLKEISNVHPEDTSDVEIQEIGEKEINESLSLTQQQMYSKLAKEVQKEVARVFYYRAKDYQTLGFQADAWEHYRVFLNTLCVGENDEEVCEEARAMADQDPLSFPLHRGNKIPSDRKPPAVPPEGSDF